MTRHVGSELGDIEVHGAGGVVWRRASDGDAKDVAAAVEVLLVHRPRYDDWSLPKGKRDSSESDEDCAVREVLEETGLSCRLHDELAQSEYVDRKGRNKRVRYWSMTVEGEAGPFAANEEVDELRWLGVPEARHLVTYAADAVILDVFAESL